MRTLNVKRLACLLVVLALLGAGTHFLHGFQVKRNASSLLRQAKDADQAGQLDDEAEYLDRYLSLVPTDFDALRQYGVTLNRLADDPAKIKLRGQAFFILERVASRRPADDELQRRLVRIAMDPHIKRYTDALDHLKTLLDKHKGDENLEADKARCLEENKEPESARQWYERALAHGREHHDLQVQTYVRLAALQRQQFQREKADKTLDLLVADADTMPGVDNDRKAQAYVAHSRYRLEQGKLAEAAADVKKARALAPEDPDVLLQSAEVARALALEDPKTTKDRLAEARRYVEEGLRHAPDNAALHEVLARLEVQAGHAKEAMDCLRRGIKAAPNEGRLYWALADLLLADNQLDEVTRLGAELRKRGFPPALLDYLRARVLFAGKKWGEAARELVQAEPALARAPDTLDMAKQADLLLAACYERLGDVERRCEVYQHLVNDLDPLSVEGYLGLGASFLAQGKLDEALAAYKEVVSKAPAARVVVARLLVFRNLRLPANQRSWGEVQRALDEAKKVPDAGDLPLLQAEVFAAQDKFVEAEAELDGARKKHPDQLEPLIALANLAERQGKEEAAVVALFDEAEKKLGDSVELRLARAAYWARHDSSKGHPKLMQLTRGLDSWKAEDQDRVLRGVAQSLVNAGDAPAATALWGRLAARPGHEHDLGVRVALFDLALQAGNDPAMDRWLNEIKAIEDQQGSDGTLWRYGTVSRLIERAKKAGKEDLPGILSRASSVLAEVGKRRPLWARVHVLEAQIDELKGKPDEAIAKYDLALNLGEQRPGVYWQLVQLLLKRHRTDEAGRVIERLPDYVALSGSMQRLGAEIAFQNHDFGGALDRVQKAGLATSDKYRDLLLYAGVCRANGKDAEAETALKEAVRRAPDEPDVWVSYVGFLAETPGKMAEAEKQLAEAERKLSPQKEPRARVAVGKCYEKLRRWDDAQKLYAAALRLDPDDIPLLKAAAGLQLTRAALEAKPGQMEEGKKYLERIVELQAKSPLEAAQAKQLLLALLAVDPDPRQSRKALEALDLLDKSAGAEASPEAAAQNRRTRAIVLAVQKDLRERLKAIQILEEMRKNGGLAEEDKFLLAQLYDSAGEWRAARELMVSFLASGRAGPVFLTRMAASFLREHDVGNAAKCVAQLEKAMPQAPATLSLKALVLKARGKEAEAVRLLQDYAGTDGADVLAAAGTLEQVKPDAAEAVYRRFVGRAKERESALVLAAYLGRQGRTDEALAECGRVRPDCRPEAVAAAAIGILYAVQPTQAQCGQVERWLNEAISRDGETEALLTALGNLRNLQGRFAPGRYDEAETLYRKVLTMPRPPSEALNNLAWLLALRGHAGEALEVVNRAVANVGPIPDLLDTLGVVELRAGQADKAVQDLVAATRQSPSAVEYFHLAEAYLAAKNRGDAAIAFHKARELGLKPESLHALEQDDYRQVVKAVP